jgi:peptidoglycan/xylan/chitin deacetylase (PgdA/CDA1 family)
VIARRGRRTATSAVFAAMAVAVAVIATGCAPAVDDGWVPPQWPQSRLEVVAAAPAPLDATGFRGLEPQRLRNDRVGVQARFAYLPGASAAASAFNDIVDDVVRQAIGMQSAATGVAYAPEPSTGLADRGCVAGSTTMAADALLADPATGAPNASGTTVVCDLVTASGSFLGFRLRVVSGDEGGIVSDTSTTLYLDAATGEIVRAAELWTEAAAEVLGSQIVEALVRDAGSLSLRPAAVAEPEQLAHLAAALGTTVPTPGGDLVFTVAPGFSTAALSDLGVPATSEPLAVSVPADVAAEVLTPFGARLTAGVGLDYTGPQPTGAAAVRPSCDLVPCVALTYDDGPSRLTPRLLDILEDRAAATFYMLGQYAAGAPDTVRRVAAEGHEVGNHTWNHPHLPELTDDEIAGQLGRTATLLRNLSGQPVATFRPPYGEFSARVLAVAGQPAMIWTVDTRDWAGPPDDALIRSAVDGATPGGIILFHDTHERTIRVTPEVLAGLKDRGFTMVTVTQLFGGDLPASGAWRAAP